MLVERTAYGLGVAKSREASGSEREQEKWSEHLCLAKSSAAVGGMGCL